ncbi:hypothetical protein PR202_ga15257 [Eleusine coracana subsp. coracana]|uniref:RING-type E3 ubiquitin transferase n=1 Tax=Eleusine coracana subsp. coracana TaxID=191504 RepID=A0AAV5CJS0_ELECO|nr:hypothetical protein QOZ80_6BG0495120 [Eleusine coracana subsp. coracana]GJM98267.1 hypothetical protein PR202_ga15257 [Eleusine coracana subsp. coracana]
MDLPWLDLPFTLLTLLLATRLAYDYYGVVAAAFTGGFSIQIFLFYCFARWYRHAVGGSRAGGDDELPSSSSSSSTRRQQQEHEEDTEAPPVLTPLLETPFADGGVRLPWSLAERCFPLVFMVFMPLVIVVFERSQADVVAYALCLLNIIVMVIWLSPDAAGTGATVSAAKSFLLRLSSDDEEENDGSGAAEKCTVCLGVMREGQQALRELPRCAHRFHEKCIGKWLKAHPTCPVCRATAVPPPDETIDDEISPV